MVPGEYFIKKGEIECNSVREVATIAVTNTGDRPVQIGSHFHFLEVNRQLVFKREAAYGFRLDIPAGTAVRFEPGEEKEVQLVALGGSRRAFGFNNLVHGKINDAETKEAAMAKLEEEHFKNLDS